jgi:hypothetical protein
MAQKAPKLNDKQYVKASGQRCPWCNGKNTNQLGCDVDGSTAWCNCDCEDCGAEWTDQFELTGYNKLHAPNGKTYSP